MSSLQTTVGYSDASRQQVESQDVSVLTRIYDADVNLAVWQRSPSQEVSRYTQWLIDQPSAFAWQEVIPGLDAWQRAQNVLPEHESKSVFIDDLAEIIDMFCCLFELDATGLRLRVLDRATCPKFHTDRVACRLISTYGGAGTEWRKISASAAEIQQVSNGAVALLKGDAWQGNDGLGLMHRSPPLAPPQKRLLLTLDFG